MAKRNFFIFTLILIGFLTLPEISLAVDEYTNLSEIGKYLELPAGKVEDLIWSLINVFHSKWEELMASPYSTPEEMAVPSIMKKAVQVQALNYLLVDAPLDTTYKIIKGGVEIARLWFAKDTSVVIDKFEKETVNKAVEEGIKFLLQKEIRVTPGATEFEYKLREGGKRKALFQYIMIYKPSDVKSGEMLIRFYSPEALKPPKNEGSTGLSLGMYTELTTDLPPFIVDVRGKVKDYKWDGDPSIHIDFPDYVPDLGIRPISRWERYVTKPVKDRIKKTRIVLEKVLERSGGVIESAKSLGGEVVGAVKGAGRAIKKGAISIWGKVKNSVSKLGAGVSSFFNPGKKGPPEISPELEEMQDALNSLKKELNREREMRKDLEEKYTIETAALIDKLDDLAEMVDTLSQRGAEVSESEVKKLVEELTQAEELVAEAETGAGEEEPEPEGAEQETVGATGEEEIIWCNRETSGNPKQDKVIFNEIAWMGTQNSANNEWIELKNISGTEIDLSGWQILDKGGQIQIIFDNQPRMLSNGFYLLERTDDNSVPGILADKIYTGALNDTNEALYLFNESCELKDEVLADPNWPAGDKISKRTMERKSNLNWQTSRNIEGTPREENSSGYYFVGGGGGGSGGGGTPPPEPTISLSYPGENPVDQEIEVVLSASNLENTAYDVKISIESEEEGILSRIYNEKAGKGENPWISSQFYLTEVFSGTSFEDQFRLKINEDKADFRGKADIIARIRETGKTGFLLEFKDKINISQPSEAAPSPTPILEVSPETLEFTAVEFSTAPQDGVFTITNIGDGDLNWTTSIEYVSPSFDGIDWLALNPDSGTTSAGASSQISVSLDISGLTPGQYLAGIIIKTQSAKQTIEVSLDIKEGEKEETSKRVVINEIAWMGTEASSSDEWIELYNNTSDQIELLNWQLVFYPPNEEEPRIITFASSLETTTPAIDGFSYFLLERSDDETVKDIEADYIYTGALNNNGGVFELRDENEDLIDMVDCTNGWFAGEKSERISMERIDSGNLGSDPNNWANNNLIIINGLDTEGNPIKGTPGKENSVLKGLGTKDSPFIITNINDLQAMNNNKSAWYELGDDIDASDTVNWNEGKGFEPIDFKGHFDGKRYVIKNLYVNRPDGYRSGLFGNISSAGEVKNVGLIDVDITAKVAGGFAGYISGTVSNCFVTGEVKSEPIDRAGGFAGECNKGTITNCYSTASVEGASSMGGFVGRTFGEARISNCYSAGDVDGSGSNIGGFLGENYQNKAICENNFWDAQTSGQSNGLCAKGKWTSGMKSEVTFINAGWDFGEIWDIKQGTYPFLKGSSWIPSSGVALGKGAGIENDPYLIENLQDLQDVAIEPEAWYELRNDIDASETKNWNNGKGFEPIDFEGHFNGNGHTIIDLFINRPESSQIGLFGWLRSGAKVERVGLVNFNITGGTNVGSLVGYSQGAVSNSYAAGTTTPSVNGVQIVGGLIGHLNNGTIENCYSTARVEGNSLVGGLIGRTFGDIKIESCFWNVESSEQTKGIGEESHNTPFIGNLPTGKTTEEMKQKETFIDWDFDTIWDIEEGKTYPFLRK